MRRPLLVCVLVSFALCAPSVAQGGTFAFSLDRSGSRESSVWRIDDDGSDLRRLTSQTPGDPMTRWQGSPLWLPGDRRILYRGGSDVNSGFGYRFGDAGVWTMRADGAEQRKLPSFGYGIEALSSDGAFLALEGKGQSGDVLHDQGDVFASRSDLSGVRLVGGGPGTEESPSFSPDGKKIVFFRLGVRGDHGEKIAPGTGRETGLYSVNVDGSDETRLSEGPAPRLEYSPDGRHIAMAIDGQLVTMRADGTDVQAWTGPDVLVGSGFEWSSERPEIFFTADTDLRSHPPFDTWAIHGVDLSSDRPRPRPVGPALGFVDDFDWTGRGVSSRDARDLSPPATVLLEGKHPATAGRSVTAAARRRPAAPAVSRRSLGFLSVDLAGVRRVEAAIARRAGRRRGRALCRFWTGRRLTGRRACSRPVLMRVRTQRDLRRRVRRIRRGTYLIGFRSSDRAGHRNRRVRLSPIRLR